MVDKIGFPFVFAKMYHSLNPGVYVLLVPCGEGTTGFNNNKWNKGDPNYEDAVLRANRALTATKGEFGGILWHQGEQDARDGVSEVSYAASLDTMVTNMRLDILRATDAPFILGELSTDWVAANAPVRSPVQSAIQDTPNRLSNAALVSSSGLVVYDGIHFDADSQRTFGSRYFTSYQSL